MTALGLADQLRRAGFDQGVANAFVFDMPVAPSLELMAVVRPDFTNVEWDFVDEMIDKVDGVRLHITFIDFWGPDAGRIVLEHSC